MCTSLAVYDPAFAEAQERLESLRLVNTLASVKQAFEELVSALYEAFKWVINVVAQAWDKFLACIVPTRVLYLSKHGKTARVRKKNSKRIIKLLKGVLS